MRPQNTISFAFAALFLLLSPIVVACLKMSTGLPVWIARHEDCGGDDRRVVVVVVLPHGQLKLNEEAVGRDQLGDRLQEIFEPRAERLIFVKAEGDVTFQEVAEVIDIAETYVDHVGLLTPTIKPCFTIRFPPFRDYNHTKPPALMKEVPRWD
jgi:biopolymer transport protein ExbD